MKFRPTRVEWCLRAEATAVDFAVGDPVIYRAHGWTPGSWAPAEFGTVTSLNDAWVFVRYAGCGGSKATRRDDLRHLRDVDVRASER